MLPSIGFAQQYGGRLLAEQWPNPSCIRLSGSGISSKFEGPTSSKSVGTKHFEAVWGSRAYQRRNDISAGRRRCASH